MMQVDPNDSRFQIDESMIKDFEVPNANKICVEGLIIGSLFSIVPLLIFIFTFSFSL